MGQNEAMHPAIRPVAVLALLAFLPLGACAEDETKDPEIRHCEAAFKRVTKDVRNRTVASTRAWMVGDNKTVAITYDGIYGETDVALRDIFKCTYYTPIGSAPKKIRRIDAIDIMVRGKHMSEAERLLVNTAIQINRPKLLP